MAVLEILLPLVLAAWLIWLVITPNAPRWRRFFPFGALALTVLHVLFFYRWQMIPLYAFTAGTALWSALKLNAPPKQDRRGARLAFGTLGIVFLAVCAAPPFLFPIPDIPSPTGEYPVGTFSAPLTDPNRGEIWGDAPGGPRQLMVQVWFPAAGTGAETAPWMDNVEIVAPAISEWIGMPAFFLDHLAYAQSDAYLDVAPADGVFPVILFSHGWGGFRTQSTYLMQELASQGFVVLSIDHSYGNVTTVFPDGTVIPHDPNTLPEDDLPTEEYDRRVNVLGTQWAADNAFVLDMLENWHRGTIESVLTGKLDFTRVGVMGHSTGGGAMVEFCAQDTRCDAALLLDGWLPPVSPEVRAAGLSQPVIFMYSELWPSTRNNELFSTLYAASTNDAYEIRIAGTDHYDFSDLPALSPLASTLGLKGPLSGDRVTEIVSGYTVAFFNTYLNEKPDDLLQSPGEFEEVAFKAK